MIDPAKPFSSRSGSRSSAAAARDDLAGLVRRAQDERFRLLKMLGEVRGQANNRQPVEVDATPQPEPAAAGLVSLPQPTPTQMREVLDKLVALDDQLESKLQRLESFKQTQPAEPSPSDESQPSNPSAPFTATQLNALIAQQVAMHADRVAQQISRQTTAALAEFDQQLADRSASEATAHGEAIAKLGDAILQDMDAQIAERGRELTEDLDTRFNEAAEKLEHCTADLNQRAIQIIDDTRRSAEATVADIEAHATAAANREDEIYNAFVRKLDQLRLNHQRTAQKTVVDTETQLDEFAQNLDHHISQLAEGFDAQAQRVIGELRDRANALIEQMASTVQSITRSADPESKDPARHPRAA